MTSQTVAVPTERADGVRQRYNHRVSDVSTAGGLDVPRFESEPVDFDTATLKLIQLKRLLNARREQACMILAKDDVSADLVAYCQRTLEETEPEWVRLSTLIADREEEFENRGGWSRFYQVFGPKGHVHRSTECTTCFETTQFGWVTEMSAMTDDEAVSLAGERCCTICFPEAPVAGSGSQLKDLEPEEKKIARANRQRRIAEKKVRLLGPDGKKSKIEIGRYTMSTPSNVYSARFQLTLDTNWEISGYGGDNVSPGETAELAAVEILDAICRATGETRSEALHTSYRDFVEILTRPGKPLIPDWLLAHCKD
jgi:hypothetical protein